jgi:signal transduction histidine kinase
MLSAEAQIKDRVRALQTGADAYVGKPYDANHLVSKIRELLRARGGADVLSSRCVLLVDDSVSFRSALQDELERAGYRVTTASSGEEGLRVAADLRPLAMIVDGVLPGIDGVTVIRRVRFDPAMRGVPCMLLTGSEDRSAELRALDAGADAFARKDEDVDVVLAKLGAIVRRPDHVSDAASTLGPRKILAVDDSLTYLESIAETLRAEGYEAVLARSGEEALELLAVEPVDCILLDLIMPGIGGREVCRRIKGIPVVRDIPLILLTAADSRAAMLEGLAVGADDFIAKSSELDVLKARVRAQIRRKQFEDENRRIREDLLRKEVEAAEARAAREQIRLRTLELELQNRHIQEANRMKSEFVANMSHELRTPLNAIIGFTQLLADGAVASDAVRQEFLRDILTSSQHLLQLINDVLDLAKVEAGRLEFHPEPVDLRSLVDEVTKTLRAIAIEKRIVVEIDVEHGLVEVVVDPARFKQIAYNYLSNALKFTLEGGHVIVRARALSDDRFAFEVQDSGIGIAPADLSRLFVEFQQLDTGTAKRHQGTGLGLALTRRLVEAQGGSVDVASTPGKGTTFRAILPRVWAG